MKQEELSETEQNGENGHRDGFEKSRLPSAYISSGRAFPPWAVSIARAQGWPGIKVLLC